jgi:hypothetical protein
LSPQKPNELHSIWGRLQSIPHDDPSLTEQTWRLVQPCKRYELGRYNIFITQPSSTFWVYLLGVLTTLLGVFFLVTFDNHTSRVLWGISLILWGVGALLAGTSYQAFGYQLKCQDRPMVAWTSWWEVIYMIFQQLSVNVMVVAVAYSLLNEPGQRWATLVAIAVSIAYCIMITYAAFKPKKALLTFELMVHWCTPMILFMAALNIWHIATQPTPLDFALLGTWLGLIATMLCYQYYLKAGIGQKLWSKGVWFSENDVLHVLLIVWVAYIAWVLSPLIIDAPL